MLKAGARDTDRVTEPDLFTVHSVFKSMFGLFISFSKNKNASDVYETHLSNANPDTNKDLIGHKCDKKQPPVKHKAQLSTSPFSTLSSWI